MKLGYPAVRNGGDVYDFMSDAKKLEREHFWVLHLNTTKKIIKKQLLKIGTESQITIKPGEVFTEAWGSNDTCAIVVVHNHPSGDVQASKEDIKTCIELRCAAKIYNISLRDFVIVGDGYISFRDLGLFKEIDKVVRMRQCGNS